jgi:hypothetical protein
VRRLPVHRRRDAVLESVPSGLVTIAAFLLMLGLLVLVHELAI